MDYTPVFINTYAMVIVLMAIYVYKNERKMVDISTRHDVTGQVGGGHYAHTGASVDYVCLPNDPDVAQPLKPHCDYDLIYGAEYQIGAYNQPQGMRSGIENRDAACAVCLAKSKMVSIIIPGRGTCYKGWTKDYSGTLMAGKYDHSASSKYACVDNDAEAIGRVRMGLFWNSRLISWPDHQEQQDIAVQFQLQSQLPGVIGAHDCTHIRISGAIGGDVDYINRKGFPSVQLQIVSDNRMLIRHAFTGWPGSTHDARVLRNSSLYNLGENSNKIAQDMHLLADSVYPLREWIITPFRDNGRLNQGQRIFNRAQIVERCIGLLKGRFRRLREISLHLLLDIIQNILSACILHNLCVVKNDNIERFMEEPDDDPNRYANIFNIAQTGLERHQQLMNNLP